MRKTARLTAVALTACVSVVALAQAQERDDSRERADRPSVGERFQQFGDQFGFAVPPFGNGPQQFFGGQPGDLLRNLPGIIGQLREDMQQNRLRLDQLGEELRHRFGGQGFVGPGPGQGPMRLFLRPGTGADGGIAGALGDWLGDFRDTIDADGDGTITAEEIQSFLEGRFGAVAGADGADGVTVQEFGQWWLDQHQDALQNRFDQLDADGDGTVTADEFNAMVSTLLERLDTNGDGDLSADDFNGRGRFGLQLLPATPEAEAAPTAPAQPDEVKPETEQPATAAPDAPPQAQLAPVQAPDGPQAGTTETPASEGPTVLTLPPVVQ